MAVFVDRKLAAILAADVAGYSRLMGADEEGTLNTLRAHREVVDGLIAARRGRVFNSAGDSVIAEFASAVEATLCAVEIQQKINGRNAAVPKNKRLEFRIGINIGDVIAEGGNLFGDGVNVADRVQKLAEPAGICVARSVHEHLRNKADLTLESMGEHQVKNIAAPVLVYRVLVPGAARRPLHQRWGAAVRRHRRVATAAVVLILLAAAALAAWPLLNPPPASDFPRLAVLPFDDFAAGAAPEHYSDGVSEDLITFLSRFPDLTVISRNASFAYKGTEIDPVAVGRELNVDYVIEGSVQKKGDGLRITAQLIDTHTNVHVWADAYEGSDASSLQDEAIRRIIGTLSGQTGHIKKHEYTKTKGIATADLDEYGYYLRGDEVFSRYESVEENDRAAAIWREGLEKFPDSSLLRVALAWAHFNRGYDFDTPRPAADYRRAGELARKALAGQNLSPMVRCLGHRLMAYIHWFEGDFERAIADAEAAVALAPYSASQLSFLARLQIAAGNTDRGLGWVQESARLDPTLPRNTRLLAWAYYLKGEYERSLEAAKTHAKLSRKLSSEAYWFMAASYSALDRIPEAQAAVKTMLEMDPRLTQVRVRGHDITFPYKDRTQLEGELADLAQAGLPELPFGYDAKTGDRLTADEVKALLFGHTIRGRDIKTSEIFTDVFAADGALTETADWGPDTGTVAYLEKSLICYSNEEWGGNCGAIFRNPGGKPERQDEYVWVFACCELYFSVIK
jgi:adenylate cyclase